MEQKEEVAPFKIGDLVIRTEPYNYGGGVVKGGVYQVSGYSSKDHIYLVGEEGGYDVNLFVLAKNEIVYNILKDL